MVKIRPSKLMEEELIFKNIFYFFFEKLVWDKRLTVNDQCFV